VLLTVSIVMLNFRSVFVDYAESYRRSAPNHRELAAVVNGYAQAFGTTNRTAYIVVWPFWLDHRVVALETGDFSWKDNALIEKAEDARRLQGQPGPKLFILNKDDDRSAPILRETFPNGVLTDHRSPTPGRDFRTFLVAG
jgi:hypothetical protein